MEQFLSFISNEKVLWCGVSLIIFLVTLALKIPYKKLTGKITNEKLRKLANKAIVLFTFVFSILLTLSHSEWANVPFVFEDSIKYALSAIALYSALEIKGNPFKTAEAEELIDKAEKAVKKKTSKEKDDKSAVNIFLTDVGKKK